MFMKLIKGPLLTVGRSGIALYIEGRLNDLGLKSADLAREAGVTRQYVSQALQGKISLGEKIMDAMNRLDSEQQIIYDIVVRIKPTELDEDVLPTPHQEKTRGKKSGK